MSERRAGLAVDRGRDPRAGQASTTTVTADRGDAGVRLDVVLRRRLSGGLLRSRTRMQRLIADGAVSVNGVVVRRASTRLTAGDQLGVSLPTGPGPAAMVPQAIGIDVLYEDEWLLVVNKPAGLIVHPSYKHPDGTLMNALLWHVRRSGLRSEPPRLLHRLDKWTSGLVVAGKTRTAHARLASAMRGTDAEKVYLAVTCRGPGRASGTIRLELARDPEDRRRVVVAAGRGRSCTTQYVRLARTGGAQRGLSLLRCRLITGRMHQIRAHLSASGWPLVGDPVYGRSDCVCPRDPHLDDVIRQFPRQALHAWRLSLWHPLADRRLSVEAPIPDDLMTLLRMAGLDHALLGQ